MIKDGIQAIPTIYSVHLINCNDPIYDLKNVTVSTQKFDFHRNPISTDSDSEYVDKPEVVRPVEKETILTVLPTTT